MSGKTSQTLQLLEMFIRTSPDPSICFSSCRDSSPGPFSVPAEEEEGEQQPAPAKPDQIRAGAFQVPHHHPATPTPLTEPLPKHRLGLAVSQCPLGPWLVPWQHPTHPPCLPELPASLTETMTLEEGPDPITLACIYSFLTHA